MLHVVATETTAATSVREQAMKIKIYRARQHSDTVGGGWSEYAYHFEPRPATDMVQGCGGGAYGRCCADATGEAVTYEVPDELGETKGDDVALFVPGEQYGYTAAEIAAGCLGTRGRRSWEQAMKAKVVKTEKGWEPAFWSGA
jgi:hypothetical protein